MKNNGKPTRYIELLDDIMNHVFQWATDDDWGKLSPNVKATMTTLMSHLKVAKALKDAGETDDGDDSLPAEKRRFVALFKQKYLKTCLMEFKDKITPINQVSIARVIHELKDENARYDEFIEWFFDDYCSLEENKKFMPPEINFMCSNHIVKKFLYKMRDSLRMRKDNINKEATKAMLLEIALPMQKRLARSEFAQKIIDFDNGILSATKFLDLMKAFAKKYNDTEGEQACDELTRKMEESQKKG